MADEKYNTRFCKSCGGENDVLLKSCKHCGKKLFAKPFVRGYGRIDKNSCVQVKKRYEGDQMQATLYKWWADGTRSYNITTPEKWEKIKELIDVRLAKYLKWKSRKEIVKEISSAELTEKKAGKSIEELAKEHPAFIMKVLKRLDLSKIEEADYQDISEILIDLLEILHKTDSSFRNAFRAVLQKLPSQTSKALEDLSSLLNTWSLQQVTSISYQVKGRLETLKLFKERVLDDRTYEIRGDNSIHRILENAMWIVDERYWLLHSNQTLRRIVGDEVVKKNKGKEEKRPDFVCGSVGNKTIVIELKRPSHPLDLDDLNQLEDYLAIIEEHSQSRTFEAYLVGRKISSELEKKSKYRGSQFKVITFADLIDDTEKRYKEYLDLLSKR